RFGRGTQHQQVGGGVVQVQVGQTDHYREHDAPQQADEVHLAAAGQADGNGPEQERNVPRFLDGGTETDDGQAADHTETERQVGADGLHDQRGDDGHQQQREVEVFGIDGAAVGLAVD